MSNRGDKKDVEEEKTSEGWLQVYSYTGPINDDA